MTGTARIITPPRRPPTRRDPLPGIAACCGAVPSSSATGSPAAPSGSGTPRTSGAGTSACGWLCCRSSNSALCLPLCSGTLTLWLNDFFEICRSAVAASGRVGWVERPYAAFPSPRANPDSYCRAPAIVEIASAAPRNDSPRVVAIASAAPRKDSPCVVASERSNLHNTCYSEMASD